MPKHNVHVYVVARVKVNNVEAENHITAIQAVTSDNDLMAEIHQKSLRKYPNDRISEIEICSSERPTGYLVDVVGDVEYAITSSFEYDNKGVLYQVGFEPGRRVPVNDFQWRALKNYADGDVAPFLTNAFDQYDLISLMSRGIDDLLPVFIAKELAAAATQEEAISLLDDAIADLSKARDAINAQ